MEAFLRAGGQTPAFEAADDLVARLPGDGS
jgi:hypothetical protein